MITDVHSLGCCRFPFSCDDCRVLLVMVFVDSLFTNMILLHPPFVEFGVWLTAVSIQVRSVVCTVAFCTLLTLLLMLLDIVFYQKRIGFLYLLLKCVPAGRLSIFGLFLQSIAICPGHPLSF